MISGRYYVTIAEVSRKVFVQDIVRFTNVLINFFVFVIRLRSLAPRLGVDTIFVFFKYFKYIFVNITLEIFYIHVGSLFGLEPQVSILIARVRLMILCGCVAVEIPHRWSDILRSKFLSLWHQDLVTVLLFIFKACSFFRAG